MSASLLYLFILAISILISVTNATINMTVCSYPSCFIQVDDWVDSDGDVVCDVNSINCTVQLNATADPLTDAMEKSINCPTNSNCENCEIVPCFKTGTNT